MDQTPLAKCPNPECTKPHPVMFTNPEKHKLWKYRVECFGGCNCCGPGAETEEEAARLWKLMGH